ncbi:serine/threonine protein kinase [Yaniella halotolerans]|uniref:serine/threonine protein kinase n=1 Tax=Yaniella halotolerans TaxID=225453 RepID=UPI0004260191|nr:protein kinase [Yaniella halotolerans]
MNSPTDRTSDLLSTRIATKFAPPQLLALDDWRVIRHLGSGSTAHVWLLHNASCSHYVACKTPKTDVDATTLSQEAQLAAGLHHENLISPSELAPALSTAHATFWEFLPAGSLAHLVASAGSLSTAQTVTVLSAMLQVAQYLQGLQIVHGDISPRNILFDLTGRPVLIDLGAVRATAHAYTQTGSPGFTAPELLGPSNQVEGLGAAADVYSLGAIGWFCLTGMIPGPPHARVPLVTMNPNLATDIIELLEASLSADPARRPSLNQLMGAVPHWEEPEPVDLFPAVGEEYELLLPTRKPLTQGTPKRRKRKQRQRQQAKARPPANAVRLTSPKPRRLVLGLGALILAGGVIVTSIYATPNVEQVASDVRKEEQVEAPHQVDFQAVIDALAKARSTAWANADASLSTTYAAPDSAIQSQDRDLLESLAEAGHSLDGIRMRATVLAAAQTADYAKVTVDWRMDRYTQRDTAGDVIEEFEPHSQNIDLILHETAEGWKITDAAP